MFDVLAVLSAVMLGLSAGVFYGFSAFVIRGLRRAEDGEAGAVMNGINAEAVRPPFMVVFMGALLLPLITSVWAFAAGLPGAGWFLAATIVYAVGTFGVTVGLNVPLNNGLLAAPDLAEGWRDYHGPWTRWNHVRAASAAVASALAVVGLL
ncbi:DUF1772 domain-containing protein [Antribacter gilvus]|uniref:anthrone oxygenase family protein n=1 Tax=Antribacter gilvus TaxID=2304675 RepID=UPI000F77947F|nr:anthrone oxygenase family protein [Antribacter gilvus]